MSIFRSFLQKHVYQQYNVGPWPGALKDLTGRALFYMAPINLFMLAATTYHVTARDYIWQFAPWVNFWMFFSGLVFVALCAMVIEFKVIVPSSITFSNNQSYKHGNLIRQDLETILQEIQSIGSRLDAIEANNIKDSEEEPKT
ncbi:hypothetical protein ACFLVB_00415 [Chloroflexota bacterium]